MKVAIILGRGIEGCGVTRYALEEQKWYKNNSIECNIYASCDKKWGRNNAQENNIIEFTNSEIKSLSEKLNSEYDIVYYQSLPSKKGHSIDYQNLFMEHLVIGIYRPIKISHQNDHKSQSLSRNFNIWEIMSYMDGSFTHSLNSPFAKKMKELNPHVPIMKMGLGFDFDSLKQYWKPIENQKRRVSYFGRFAGFKDPNRIIDMHSLLKEQNIIGELRGIERSIGAFKFLLSNYISRTEHSKKENIYEVKNNEIVEQGCEKIYVYGPFNRLDGIEELSYSMFGADFYNLDVEAYGDNMEFAMCEIIACGSIPLFDKHWADNCYFDGTIFSKLKDFAIYSDRNNLQDTVNQMKELADNNELREKRRQSCFEIAKKHCDNSIVYKDMHEKALSCGKTNIKQYKLF